ncbi:MAG: exo-alpha-sialidase [Verrucomicrobiales bacterium]|nr:exo-alpha-sialidase [Verrucomicrobiales bacterium]
MKPASIGASSAPAMLKRLASGRLLLVWNQLYPEGKTTYERRSGNYSQRAGSWHREELSIAFSDNDGESWTPPTVIARKAKTWISYPYVLERHPGEIWITTMQWD